MRTTKFSQKGFVGFLMILITLAIVSFLVVQNSASLKNFLRGSSAINPALKDAPGIPAMPEDAMQDPAKTIEYFKDQAKQVEKEIQK